MSLMSRPARSTAALVAAAALVATAGSVAMAGTPTIGAQATQTSGISPISVPGNHLHRGDHLPQGAVLVSRVVTTTDRTTKRRVTLTLPKTKRLTGIAFTAGSSNVDVQLAAGQEHYVGKRRVTFVVHGRNSKTNRANVFGYAR